MSCLILIDNTFKILIGVLNKIRDFILYVNRLRNRCIYSYNCRIAWDDIDYKIKC